MIASTSSPAEPSAVCSVTCSGDSHSDSNSNIAVTVLAMLKIAATVVVMLIIAVTLRGTVVVIVANVESSACNSGRKCSCNK
jgi:hypothetical protein